MANAATARHAEPEAPAPPRLQTVSMEAAVATVRAVLPVAETWTEVTPEG